MGHFFEMGHRSHEVRVGASEVGSDSKQLVLYSFNWWEEKVLRFQSTMVLHVHQVGRLFRKAPCFTKNKFIFWSKARTFIDFGYD